MISLDLLGAKVRKYREQLQETLAVVSTATGLDESRLAAIEAGGVEPTGDEILILADHFRCDYKFFISNDRVAPFEQTDTLYRAHGDAFSPEDRRAVQDFLYLCETEAFLLNELGRLRRPFPFSSKETNFKRRGEQGAKALRSHLGYDDRVIPVDVYQDMRTIGIHVFRRKLGNSAISGLFIQHPTAGLCALVNFSEDLYRQRFSAAHEMAHAIFDTDQAASVSFVSPDGEDRREWRANRFASCFLMPPALLKALPPPTSWSDEQVKFHANSLRVSCVALGWALNEAGLVDKDRAAYIRSLRVRRDDKLDPELPPSLSNAQRSRKQALLERGLSDFYVGLCFDALHAGLISTSRLAEALFCSQAELFELATMYGRTTHGH